MSRRNLTFIVEVMLVLGIISSVVFLIYGHNIHDDELKSLWGNFSTEVLGVWVSVRIIQYIFDSRNKFHRTRLHLTRTYKWVSDRAWSVINYPPPYLIVIKDLEGEIEVFETRWDRRKKYLHTDECQMALALNERRALLLEKIIELNNCWYSQENDSEAVSKFDELRSQFHEQLLEYDLLVVDFRRNIWEESHPDDI